QGDPGSSRFYLSLEDDLLRIFGADRMQGMMERLGMEEGVPIEHRLITRAIRNAQEKVEAHNFDIRKHLLEYDDVLNKQREVIYGATIMRHLEKLIMLQTLDALWKDHLLNMDHLKEGIGLRGYGQVNPLQAYQKEGYEMFEDMIRRMEADAIEKLMSVQL